MRKMLQHTAVVVTAKQCLRKVKGFSASHALPASRLEACGKQGGEAARSADPDGPMGCSIPCDVMLSMSAGELAGGQWPLLGNGLGIGWW